MAIGVETELTYRELHDLVVSGVAEARFGLEDWQVITNTSSDAFEGSSEAIPDIIARSHGRIVATGEVEIAETITDERARYWKSLSDSCVRFYLYVPHGIEDRAIELMTKHSVSCAGLRTYTLNGHLEINAVPVEGMVDREDDHPWWTALGSCDNN